MTTPEAMRLAREALADMLAEVDPDSTPARKRGREALAAIDAIPQHDAQPNCHSTRPDVAPPSRPDDYCTDSQCRMLGRCRFAAPAADIDEEQLARLSERGAVAWAGVTDDDIRALRDGSAPSGEPADTLCQRLQQQCSDWGTYWRASDAHGVDLSHEQALELLRDALGVEVAIAAPLMANGLTPSETAPIDMVLHCPACGLQHIDAPEPNQRWGTLEWSTTGAWINPPHRSHLCHGCGHIWRPADVPTNGVDAVKTKGKADSPIAVPAGQAATASVAGLADWTTPTTVQQRMSDAVTLLCAGKRPPDDMVAGWLDRDAEDGRLQEFAIEHGPAWAQGIALLDAAWVMVDQPTEGVDHEHAAPQAVPVPAPSDDWQHLKPHGYAPGNYMSKCHRCNQVVTGLDMRAVTCRPCAGAMHAQASTTGEPQ